MLILSHENPMGTRIVNNLHDYIFYKRALIITKKYVLHLTYSIRVLKAMD
jgi:hypothetical protein